MTKIETLEKQLSESNEIVKRSKCAEHITQMTPMFRKRSGLGFLDESSTQPPLENSKGKEIVFVKTGFNAPSKPEIEENINTEKNEPVKGLTNL